MALVNFYKNGSFFMLMLVVYEIKLCEIVVFWENLIFINFYYQMHFT